MQNVFKTHDNDIINYIGIIHNIYNFRFPEIYLKNTFILQVVLFYRKFKKTKKKED